MCRQSGRKRALQTRSPVSHLARPNWRWSLDFVSTALSGGWRFRIKGIIDTFAHECLTPLADNSLLRQHVVRKLETLVCRRWTKPRTIVNDNIVNDNDTELTSITVPR